jgi:hypothetical protein
MESKTLGYHLYLQAGRVQGYLVLKSIKLVQAVRPDAETHQQAKK